MPSSFIAGRLTALGRPVKSGAGCKRASNWRRYWKRAGKGRRPSRSCCGVGTAARDTAVKKKIGQLLLSYGAPREAADVFRDVVRTDDRDADAYAGLGEAELALENYQEARDAFQKALQSESIGRKRARGSSI